MASTAAFTFSSKVRSTTCRTGAGSAASNRPACIDWFSLVCAEVVFTGLTAMNIGMSPFQGHLVVPEPG